MANNNFGRRFNLTNRGQRVAMIKQNYENAKRLREYGDQYNVENMTSNGQKLSNSNLRKIQTRKRGYFGSFFNKIRGRAPLQITEENVNKFKYNQLKNQKRGLIKRFKNMFTRKNKQNTSILLQPTKKINNFNFLGI